MQLLVSSLNRYMTANMEEPERSRTSQLLCELLDEKPEFKSLAWREHNVRTFNRHLEDACKSLGGVTYLDVNDKLLDSEGFP